MKNYHIFKKEFLSKIYCNKMHAILRRCGISLRNWNGDHHQASKQPMPLHLQPSQHPLSFPIQRHFWRNMWNFTQKIKNTHTPANPTLEVQNFLPTCPKIIQLLNLGSSDTWISSTLVCFILYCRICATLVPNLRNPSFLHHHYLSSLDSCNGSLSRIFF